MLRFTPALAVLAVALAACDGSTPPQTPSETHTEAATASNTPTPVPTATPTTTPTLEPTATPTATPTPELTDGTYVWRYGAWRDPVTERAYVEPTPIPAAPTAPVYDSSSAGTGATTSYAACLAHPDRYNWRKYASAYAWPLDELAYVIQRESGGDLCAVNASSGATCWIQQHPGGAAFFDPVTCMSQGYSKWVDGGGSFERHWYRFW